MFSVIDVNTDFWCCVPDQDLFQLTVHVSHFCVRAEPVTQGSLILSENKNRALMGHSLSDPLDSLTVEGTHSKQDRKKHAILAERILLY